MAISVPSGYPDKLERLVGILGVPFHQVTLAGAVERVEYMIAEGGAHYVVTPNVDFLVKARRDEELRRILVNADLVLCDGKPIVWASHWLGGPLPCRVAGSDLVPLLAKRAAERGWRMFILGGEPAAAEAAARRMAEDYPRLPPVAHYSPPHRPLEQMDDAEIQRRIHEARPDILLVCFGCPKQEKWIGRNSGKTGVPVMIGAGATVDFLANRVLRAPRWMRSVGLEWLFRLMQEPKRLIRRYADDFIHFFPAIVRQRWRQSRLPGAKDRP
ncbi:MAG TPA: WecB/TagA/CpsF family glycosyltransferase [Opitutaceae bacterium]|jgi:exopolysaccharide biosynthesis WecB/TagA/CpsF family protein|nr:WecB/TagA/CpsF family glycosyltransferase [Opitutaceae bacterium]